SALEILGIAAVSINRVDLLDPVEVGKRTTYRIQISNSGSLPASGIEVKGIIPPEMRFVSAKAPVKEQVAGQVVTFAKLDDLQPNQTAEFFIEVEALKVGQVVFRVEVNSPSMENGPRVQDEPTRILPANGAGPAGKE